MYMRSDYQIECNGTHDMYRILAGIVFTGAALGSPLILGSVLYHQRERFLAQSPDSQHYDPDTMPDAFVRDPVRPSEARHVLLFARTDTTAGSRPLPVKRGCLLCPQCSYVNPEQLLGVS